MSNASVGNIYHQIINEVIEASRVDFEDQGVGEEVLEELRKGWQVKLSKLQVAAFPWDPPPPPPAQAPAQAQAQTQAQQAVSAPQPASGVPAAPAQQMGTPSYTSATLSPQPAPNAQPQPLANGLPQVPGGYSGRPEVKQEPIVKQEPGLANNGMQQTPTQVNAYGNTQGNVAAQRAAAQLQNTYGSRAAASISAIQGYGQGGQPQNSQGPARPGVAVQPNQGQRLPQQAQYNQQMANQLAMQQQQQQQQRGAQHPPPRPGQQNNGFQQSQVDGPADDYEGILMRKDQNGETSEVGRVEIDRMLHDQIAARAKQMEGGGLMLPLKEATKHKSIGKKTASGGPSGFDGVDDDIKEEVDEDAINSDLDDPDEVDIADDDDEENMGHIMLCMYDKVQRVKNKWKCTMKDGVLNVNGKDYVFHKATGEYEW